MFSIDLFGFRIRNPFVIVAMGIGLGYILGWVSRLVVAGFVAWATVKIIDVVEEAIAGGEEGDEEGEEGNGEEGNGDDDDDNGDDTGYTDPNGGGDDWSRPLWDIGSRGPAPTLTGGRRGLPTQSAPPSSRDADQSAAVALGFDAVLDPSGTVRATKRSGSNSYGPTIKRSGR